MPGNHRSTLTRTLVIGVAPGAFVTREVVTLVRSSKLQWKEMSPGNSSTYVGGQYCGPGWGFTQRDVESGKIAELPAAVDAIDEACRHHDQCYGDHGYFTQSCNVRLATDLTKIIVSSKSTPQQRLDAAIMAAIFATEAAVVDPTVKLAVSTRDALAREYRELISAGAEFIFVIEQGIWHLTGGQVGNN